MRVGQRDCGRNAVRAPVLDAACDVVAVSGRRQTNVIHKRMRNRTIEMLRPFLKRLLSKLDVAGPESVKPEEHEVDMHRQHDAVHTPESRVRRHRLSNTPNNQKQRCKRG